jgi:hypothetical protein
METIVQLLEQYATAAAPYCLLRAESLKTVNEERA